MFEWSYAAAALIFLLATGLNLVLGLTRRLPARVGLASMILVELTVLATLLVGIIATSQGRLAKGDTIEFFVYVITASLVPLAGLAWTLVERNRWGSYIYALVGLTAFVMLFRMHQIWFGA
jgi:hypothetical protein